MSDCKKNPTFPKVSLSQSSVTVTSVQTEQKSDVSEKVSISIISDYHIRLYAVKARRFGDSPYFQHQWLLYPSLRWKKFRRFGNCFCARH